MLNYIWAGMIIVGIVYGGMSGNIEAVSNGAIDSAKEAITLCITMVGVVSLWTGLMEIAKECGILGGMKRMLRPIMRFLFPRIPEDDEASEHILTNIVSNILGLGWAATPAGLRAMKALAKLNNHSKIASREMCTFLVINISSLQIIPVNVIAYRSQYGSVNPASIVMPAIIATFISTFVAIVFCKLLCIRDDKK